MLCSLFTASYIFNWTTFFPDVPLRYPPSFDARIVLYPGMKEIRDYFSWRQVDTHINNLYNTTFWALIRREGLTPKDAHETLRGTGSSQKQELLFSRFNINYNALPLRFRKGSVLVREQVFGGEANANETPQVLDVPRTSSFGSISSTQTLVAMSDYVASPKVPANPRAKRESTRVALLQCDIIGDEFWNHRPYLLLDDRGRK